MSVAIGLIGLGLSCLGAIPTPGDDGAVKCACPGLAGCGMATFLGVMAAQVLV